MHRRAGTPFQLIVGDGASLDGSFEMLESFARNGVLLLERADRRRSHAEWLDHWYATCRHRYLVFSDSDVDYRGDGWLTDMVAMAQSTGAALVAARFQSDWQYRPRFASGEASTLPGERPEHCLMLLDLQQLRDVVDASFAWHEEPFLGDTAKKLAFDVGGAFLREVRRAGLGCAEMPPSFQAKYRHWGGLTWKKPSASNLGAKKRGKQIAKVMMLRARLLAERVRDNDLIGRYELHREALIPSGMR